MLTVLSWLFIIACAFAAGRFCGGAVRNAMIREMRRPPGGPGVVPRKGPWRRA
jgi:hypothetical protein